MDTEGITTHTTMPTSIRSRRDAKLLSETWRQDKSEIWETHHKHIFVGAGKYDAKHGVGIMLNKRWRPRIIDT